LAIGTAIAGYVFIQPGVAARLELPNVPYDYVVLDQDVAAALREFARHHALTLNLSPEVKGRIRGRLPPGNAREFLDRLGTLHGFEWYFDGSVLHVTAVSERTSRTVAFRGRPEEALRNLESLGITDERWRVQVGSDGRTGMVSGPPRFIAKVTEALGSQVEAAAPQPAAPRKPNLVVIYRGSQVSTVRPGHID
jgi:type III secretion protein C